MRTSGDAEETFTTRRHMRCHYRVAGLHRIYTFPNLFHITGAFVTGYKRQAAIITFSNLAYVTVTDSGGGHPDHYFALLWRV